MEAAFLGVGNMGLPMATRLLDGGHRLTVYDIRETAMQPLLDRQARRAASPRELADQCEIVFVSLPEATHDRRGRAPAAIASRQSNRRCSSHVKEFADAEVIHQPELVVGERIPRVVDRHGASQFAAVGIGSGSYLTISC